MKNNKKGFTLAELLIVVAIIAILIAIAIPVFSGQLDNAKIQTDHANMRSAYALAQTGSIQGGLYVGSAGSDEFKDYSAAAAAYYFQADGSIATDNTKAYKLKATASGDKCKESAVCNLKIDADTIDNTSQHVKDNYIMVVKTAAGGFSVKLGTVPGSP